MFGHLSTENKLSIEGKLCENSSRGWMWSKAVYFYFSDFMPQSLPEVFGNIMKLAKESETSKISLLHTIQTFATDLTYDHVCDIKSPIEKIVALRSLMHCDEIDVQIAEIFTVIEEIEKHSRIHFLYERYGTNYYLSYANPKLCKMVF